MRAPVLADIGQDLRVSMRSLLRTPAVALTIFLTVGLGIGATTLMFAAVDAAVLRPLPYTDSGQLVRIYTDSPPYRFRFSLVDLLALESQQTHFSSVAAYTERTMGFSDGSTAERLRGRLVSWQYFDLLDIDPIAGRRFVEADGRRGTQPAVIVSHRFWQERLGGRPDAIGSLVRLDGSDHTLVGVLPRTTGPLETGQDFFIAAQWEPPPRKGPFAYIVLGRLKTPGHAVAQPFRAASDASVAQPFRAAAVEELRAINRRLFPLWKASYQDERATWNLMDLQRYMAGDSGPLAAVSLGAVLLVWLVACANAANLMIARVTNRRRELAVRAALGASRTRVLAHVLSESVALAAASAVFGVLVAWAGMDVVRSLGATYLPRTGEMTLQGRTLWALAALTVCSLVLFGLLPALLGTGRVGTALAPSRTATAGVGARRLRDLLVASEFAIATPLLALAGLLLASLAALQRVDVGFETTTLLTASVQLPAAQYREADRITATWEEIRRRLSAAPGVVHVAFADSRPPDDVPSFNNFELEAHPTPPGGSQPVTPWLSVTPEYFRALGLRLLEGRLLDDRDRADPNAVVVVDEAWAKRFFPRGGAVGARLRGGGCSTCPWTTVVGVVSTVKYAGLDQPDEGAVYSPLVGERFRNVIVRTALPPASLIPELRRAVREVEAAAPVSSVQTGDELVGSSLQRPRSLSGLVATLAVVALLLSAIGIYGVMAYFVQQHAREMSIRLALGGAPANILTLVVGRGMRVVLIGVVLGLGIALAAARGISTLLYGVSSVEPGTFAAASLLLMLTALAACAVPGRRAMRLEPATVLRNE